MKLSDCKDELGQFFQWADGGYTILYLDENRDALCASCANKEGMSTEVKSATIYWEGPAIECIDCHDGIESAYGNPEDKRDGEKFVLMGGAGLPDMHLPADSYPIRSRMCANGTAKSVWPWDGGEYLLTYGARLVGHYYDKTVALALLDNLTGLCEVCSHPLYRSQGSVCAHTEPIVEPAYETKELFVRAEAKEQVLSRLAQRHATIEYAYVVPTTATRKFLKVSYIVFK